MITASVAVGKAYKTKEGKLPADMCPPQGYNAVFGEVTHRTRVCRYNVSQVLMALGNDENTADRTNSSAVFFSKRGVALRTTTPAETGVTCCDSSRDRALREGSSALDQNVAASQMIECCRNRVYSSSSGIWASSVCA